MTINKIVSATAFALTLGIAVSAQAAQLNPSNIDRITADTNPAAFAGNAKATLPSYNARGTKHFSHVIEATRPNTLGGSHEKEALDAEQNQINLPYQRG